MGTLDIPGLVEKLQSQQSLDSSIHRSTRLLKSAYKIIQDTYDPITGAPVSA